MPRRILNRGFRKRSYARFGLLSGKEDEIGLNFFLKTPTLSKQKVAEMNKPKSGFFPTLPKPILRKEAQIRRIRKSVISGGKDLYIMGVRNQVSGRGDFTRLFD